MILALFILFSVLAIISAVLMLSNKNPVYCALFLIVTFFCLAGLYFLLDAQFLGFIQIIVYAGAIMVLFLFVIMLLNLRQEIRLPIGRKYQVFFSLFFAVVMLVQLFMVLHAGVRLAGIGDFSPEKISETGNVETIGMVLFSKYLYPFEIASLLLLVGMVGAIILGRKKLPKEL